MALQGEKIEIATLLSLAFSAKGSLKYYIDSILSTIHCPALESLAISGLDLEDEYAWDLPYTQALSFPLSTKLRSIKLEGIECDTFIRHFDFTKLPALDTISLMDCTFPMAALCPLLSSPAETDGDILWPAFRVVKLCRLGANDFNDLSDIISHRRACGKPIEIVAIDSVSLGKFAEQVEQIKQHVVIQRGKRGRLVDHTSLL